MGTEIAKRDMPAATPQLTQSMSPQERVDHRQKIAFEVEVILHSYWQSSPPPAIKAGILADWCDALDDWTQEQVVWSLRKWRNDNPDKRPNPGHILAICKNARGRRIAKEMAQKQKTEPAPRADRITAERAAEIVREAGIGVRL